MHTKLQNCNISVIVLHSKKEKVHVNFVTGSEPLPLKVCNYIFLESFYYQDFSCINFDLIFRVVEKLYRVEQNNYT